MFSGVSHIDLGLERERPMEGMACQSHGKQSTSSIFPSTPDDSFEIPLSCRKAGIGHLCSKCFDVQSSSSSIPTLSRNDSFKNVAMTSNMRDRPDGRDSPLSQESHIIRKTRRCKCHGDRRVDFYCHKHREAVCGVCAYKEHKSCSAGYLPDMSTNFKESDEFKDATKSLDEMDKKAKKCLIEAVNNLKTIKDKGNKLIDNIKSFRSEITEQLDQLESDAIMLAESITFGNEEKIKRQILRYKQIRLQLTDARERLTETELSDEEAYMSTKNANLEIEEMQTDLDRVSGQIFPAMCTFKPDERIVKEILFSRSLGVLEVSSQAKARTEQRQNDSQTGANPDMNFSKRIDINVKVDGDKDSKITGMTLLSQRVLLLVDKNNKCIKYVDTTTFAVVVWQAFSWYPFGIASVKENTAAITFPSCQHIQIVTGDRHVSHMRTVNVSGDCHGIAAYSDRLIVTYVHPAKVEIMDVYGVVYWAFLNDEQGRQLFQCPIYVAVNAHFRPHDDVIFYVSDSKTNIVTKMSTSEHVLGKCVGVSEPSGITMLQYDSFIVCYRHRQELVSVSSVGHIQRRLGTRDGLRHPMTSCFCPQRNMLYVSNYRPFENDVMDNVVSVFSVHNE